jgi:hypothetical protein
MIAARIILPGIGGSFDLNQGLFPVHLAECEEITPHRPQGHSG